MDKNHYSDFYKFLNRLKKFFIEKDFMEVSVPPLVTNPGIEPHIHPYQISSAHKKENLNLYLNTSPEFWMKKLLSSDNNLSKIFNLSFSFRDEPISEIHRSQFLMLEWYRSNSSYEKILDDTLELINYLSIDEKYSSPIIKTVNELFSETLGFEILDYLDIPSIKKLIKDKFPDIHIPEDDLNWDDYYFLIFLNKIEPNLKDIPLLVLKEYPAPLSALSKISSNDSRICERFEIYLDGIEIANCFHELCNLETQKQRAIESNEIKIKNYNYSLPEPIMLYQSLEQGLPDPSGIALGVERLYSILNNKNFFLSNF